jgi:hypothetical protein
VSVHELDIRTAVREMALGMDADANMARVMEWLRSDNASPDAVRLREELAYLLFYGDPTWAHNDDSVSDYRGILSTWLESDSGDEATFLQMTAPGEQESEATRQMFVMWFTPVVDKWKEWAKANESAVEKGIANPGYAADQTPGTQYYWYDPDNEVYLYSSTADAPDDDWLSYEDRRYTPVAYDDARETNYRQDVVTGDYEFQSKVEAKWLTAAQWDSEVWLSLAEANARITGAPAPAEQAQPAVPTAEQQATVQAVYDQIVLPALEQLGQSRDPAVVSILSQPGGRERLEAEVRRAASQMLAAAQSS